MMNSKDDVNQLLLAEVDALFIGCIGPFGRMIISDARSALGKKEWKGPSSVRNYVKTLSTNLDNPALREKFLAQAEKSLLKAEKR